MATIIVKRTDNYSDELSHAGRVGMKKGQHIFCAGPDCTAKVHANDGSRSSSKSKSGSTTQKSDNDKKLVDEVVKKFKNNNFDDYAAEYKQKIGTEEADMYIRGRKGHEQSDASAAVSFMKKFNINKAKEGLAKEYYDNDYQPDLKKQMTRDQFKKSIRLEVLDINPELGIYEAWWDDGGTYGGHAFVDEGSMKDMKVRYRSMQG